MYRLHWRPQTRSSRVEWVLAELGVPYERVLAPPGGTDAARALHPLGRVPVLEDETGRRLIESAALCTWLADRHADRGLVPAPGSPERARHDQWLWFVMTELEPLLELVSLHRAELPESERVAGIVPWASARMAGPLAVLESELAEQGFLLGPRPQIVDLVLGGMLSWAVRQQGLSVFTRVRAYVARLRALPTARRLFADSEPS